MRLIAAALFAGLALIAGAMVVTGDRWVWSSDSPSYNGYEPVIRTWLELSRGFKVDRVERVRGPFYRVLYRIKQGRPKCVLVDASTQYAAKGDLFATFWFTGGADGHGSSTNPGYVDACRESLRADLRRMRRGKRTRRLWLARVPDDRQRGGRLLPGVRGARVRRAVDGRS